MRRRLLFACAALALLAAGFFAARPILFDHFQRHMLHVHPQGQRTPAVPYEELRIDSSGRTLRAFFVPAGGPRHPRLNHPGRTGSSWADPIANRRLRCRSARRC